MYERICKMLTIFSQPKYVNSLRPSDVSKLAIIVPDNACRLVGAKPLSEPMLEYC